MSNGFEVEASGSSTTSTPTHGLSGAARRPVLRQQPFQDGAVDDVWP